MKLCQHCKEQAYDERANDGDRCMACQGIELMISGVQSLNDLPLHEVTEEGVNLAEQRYMRLRYADGSEDLIDPIPWPEEVAEIGGQVARPDENLS
jgi:hypothetical protein